MAGAVFLQLVAIVSRGLREFYALAEAKAQSRSGPGNRRGFLVNLCSSSFFIASGALAIVFILIVVVCVCGSCFVNKTPDSRFSTSRRRFCVLYFLFSHVDRIADDRWGGRTVMSLFVMI